MKKYALITGASTGIGEEFAKQFAALKKPLIIVARSKEPLEKLARTLNEKEGIEVHTSVFATPISGKNGKKNGQ